MVKQACLFWLGTHQPFWLDRTDVPLFISARRLRRYQCLPRARGPWALDSGGFSELLLHGRYQTTAAQYAHDVRRYAVEIGQLQWAAIQDWMCEPVMLAKTGLTVTEHQRRTIASYCELHALAHELPWIPVLQGWTYKDYLNHERQWHHAGVTLAYQPLVGLGSVCRRQNTDMVEHLIRNLSSRGIKLHGFGFKLSGLSNVADVLASADSMAWSFSARWGPPLPECKHTCCNNCLRYALKWRQRVLDTIARASMEEAVPEPLLPTFRS